MGDNVRYENKAGKVVPRVSTILDVEGGQKTQALIQWANKLGLNGVSVNNEKARVTDIGTLAHWMCLKHLSLMTDTELPDNDIFKGYTEEQMFCADKSFKSFLKWKDLHDVVPVFIEKMFVSEKYQVGGTPDFYGYVDGKLCIMDLKTGGSIYSTAFTQTAIYTQFLIEHGYVVDEVRIVRISQEGVFNPYKDEVMVQKLELHVKKFEHLLAIYNLNKQIARKT